MNNQNKLIEKIILYTMFSVFFIIGIKSFQDYGISFDEICHRKNGLLFYNFIKSFFFELNVLEQADVASLSGKLIDVKLACFRQPVLFDLPIEFLIDLLNIKKSYQIFELRHFFTFFYFFISTIFFFLILRKRFSNKIYAYTGVLLLFLSPRIFSESFYNNKDIVFLSFTIIYIYFAINFINKPNLKSSIFFSLATALAFDIRIMALLFIIITYFIIFMKILEKKDYLKKNLKFFSTCIVLTPIFIFIFWPYLWLGGIDNLIFSFQNIPKTLLNNLYLGEYLYPQNTPWHYNLVWIFITSPITVSLFFIIGFFLTLMRNTNRVFKIENNENSLWNSNNEMYDSFCLYVILIIFISLITFNYNFDGWRHLYFIYPFIISLALTGVYFLNILLKKKFFKISIFAIILFELIYLSYWNLKYHPYQYVFFNPFIKNYAKVNFDLDYWGVSNKTALEYIVENDNRNKIKIARISFTSLSTSLNILKEDQIKRIKIVGNFEDADYVIDNYRKGLQKVKNLNLLKENFVKYYDIKVDNIIINTIYKKK
jgi:hypothetical protein